MRPGGRLTKSLEAMGAWTAWDLAYADMAMIHKLFGCALECTNRELRSGEWLRVHQASDLK